MLEDKVVVVTGASQGLGKALALAYAEEGAKVVVNSRSEDSIRPVAEEVEGKGAEVLAVAADVSKSEDVEKLVEEAVERFRRIDVLVKQRRGAGTASKYRRIPGGRVAQSHGREPDRAVPGVEGRYTAHAGGWFHHQRRERGQRRGAGRVGARTRSASSGSRGSPRSWPPSWKSAASGQTPWILAGCARTCAPPPTRKKIPRPASPRRRTPACSCTWPPTIRAA